MTGKIIEFFFVDIFEDSDKIFNILWLKLLGMGGPFPGVEKVLYPGIVVASQIQIWKPILSGSKVLPSTI